tara:strand:+ start:60 stop:197 length:138 start_codon:yes stop_codon:yes gene_type:complete
MLTDILWEVIAAALNIRIATSTIPGSPGSPGSHIKKTYQLKLINQ